jgi:hypothetical protein
MVEMGMRLALLLLALAGCAPLPTAPPPPEDVALAVELAASVYHAKPEWPRPTIVFHVGVKCIETPVPVSGGGCADGYWHPRENTIEVGWWTGVLSSSSVPHELLHWYYWQRDRDSDSSHQSRGWEFFVPDAESALAQSGI